MNPRRRKPGNTEVQTLRVAVPLKQTISMKNITETIALTEAPKWLPANLRAYWEPTAPDKLSVAGDYRESELWMLENHVKDMERGRSYFCIAPMGDTGGVGTYRLGMK